MKSNSGHGQVEIDESTFKHKPVRSNMHIKIINVSHVMAKTLLTNRYIKFTGPLGDSILLT